MSAPLEKAKPIANPYATGPMLSATGLNPKTRNWGFSALIVTDVTKHPHPPAVRIFEESKKVEQLIQPRTIHQEGNYAFHKYVCEVPRDLKGRPVQLIVNSDKDPLSFDVEIPGTTTPVRFGYFSCNGFHDPARAKKYGGIQPMWDNLIKDHKQKPLNLVLGGGDQIYNDILKRLRSYVEWRGLSEAERFKAPFTDQMRKELREFFLQHYLEHWNEPGFKDAMSMIPTLFTLDDHEIIDGAKSFRDVENNCPVIQGIYEIGMEFYLLFQQHATEALMPEMDFFGVKAHHFIREISDTTAVLALDARGERTYTQIVDPESYDMMFERLNNLSPSVKQVVVMLSVPIIYPALEHILDILEFLNIPHHLRLDLVRKIFGKGPKLDDNTPITDDEDLLDDGRDHWKHYAHMIERLALLLRFQEYAKATDRRMIYVSGDVHCASQGKTYSAKSMDPKYDPLYMPQFTSSAIGNEPPPEILSIVMHKEAVTPEKINEDSLAKLIKWLSDDGTRNDLFILFRNYLVMKEQPDGMKARLYAEIRTKRHGPKDKENPANNYDTAIKTYTTIVPHLMKIAEPNTPKDPKGRKNPKEASATSEEIDLSDVPVKVPTEPKRRKAPKEHSSELSDSDEQPTERKPKLPVERKPKSRFCEVI